MTQISKKLTTIVRDDISPGYKVAQSIHSVVEFSIKHSNIFTAWYKESNYICCLETTTTKLREFINLLELLEIKYSVFLEPDINDELTAITLEPIDEKLHKNLFKNLKLTNSGQDRNNK